MYVCICCCTGLNRHPIDPWALKFVSSEPLQVTIMHGCVRLISFLHVKSRKLEKEDDPEFLNITKTYNMAGYNIQGTEPGGKLKTRRCYIICKLLYLPFIF